MNAKQKKTIIETIIEFEIEKHNLDINFATLYRMEFYKPKNLIESFNNSSLKDFCTNLKKTFRAGASFSFTNKMLLVFLDRSNAPGISRPISELLRNTYHELYHAIQQKELESVNTDVSYDLFATQCDFFLLNFSNELMSKYYVLKGIHDSQMFEIMANLYGVENSLNFLKNSNIDCSEKEIIELEKQYKLFQQQYENYNLTERLNLIIKDYCKYVNNSNFDKTIFKLFLNDDGSIKDINSIFSNDVVLKLDPKILLAFIKAYSIKKMISETSLSERTSNILNELLSKGSINSLQDQKTTKSFNI